jgi:hypothetical protein
LAKSDRHVAVGKHTADDASEFHWKLSGVTSEKFDAIVNKAWLFAQPIWRIEHGNCCTVEAFHPIAWSQTRRYPEGDLCNAASDPISLFGPLVSRICLDLDPCYEIWRLLRITEEDGHSVREITNITKVPL